MKRLNLMIKESHHKKLTELELNISGLIRDLLDDYFSEFKITLNVQEETRNLYDRIVSNTGSDDSEIEVYFKKALGELLEAKIAAMQKLHASMDC